jgi:hypothetical protein
MKSWIKVCSVSVLLLLTGCLGQHTKEMTVTSGICAWVKENYVHAKKTDDPATKRQSAHQIQWYNSNCVAKK